MRNLGIHMTKAIIRNDFRPTKVLELGGIRARFRREPDQFQRAVQIAIMISGNISDKVGGVILPDPVFANFQFHSSSNYAKKVKICFRKPFSQS